MEDEPSISPLSGDIKADVCIIGAGYTGLASAYYLSEAFPERKIVLLESERIGYGASGRNAGIVLPLISGSEKIVDGLIKKGHIDKAQDFYDKTSAGIGLIDNLIKDQSIKCDWEDCLCLYGAATDSQIKYLEEEFHRYDALGLKTQWLTETDLQRCVYVKGFKAAITIPMSSTINPAKLVRGLIPVLQDRRIGIYEGSEVVKIQSGNKITASTSLGSVTAPSLVLATNAYTSKLGYFHNRMFPIHVFSIATEPLSDKQINDLNWGHRQPLVHAKNLFDLFRLTSDNRIVFSGGRMYYFYQNRLPEDEYRSDYDRLRQSLIDKLPSLECLNISHKWSGLMGLTLNRTPMIGIMGSKRNIFYGLGYSGHGVAASFLAGKLICNLYAGDSIDPAYDFIINARAPYIPPEPFRWAGFALYQNYLSWKDSR
jgi:glycine/D-amino acid oxidase-like deaminating enzyme